MRIELMRGSVWANNTRRGSAQGYKVSTELCVLGALLWFTVNQHRPKYAIYIGHIAQYSIKADADERGSSTRRSRTRTMSGTSGTSVTTNATAETDSESESGLPACCPLSTAGAMSFHDSSASCRACVSCCGALCWLCSLCSMLPPPVRCWCKSLAFNTNLDSTPAPAVVLSWQSIQAKETPEAGRRKHSPRQMFLLCLYRFGATSCEDLSLCV